jgi:hypothetical protein
MVTIEPVVPYKDRTVILNGLRSSLFITQMLSQIFNSLINILVQVGLVGIFDYRSAGYCPFGIL